MEEIITLDGRQFKLTVDRPLNATERAQVLTEIRKQTGCGTCHQPRTLSTGFEGIYGLPFGTTVTGSGVTGKQSGHTVTLTANPNYGVAPYNVYFWKSLLGASLTTGGITSPTGSTNVDGGTVTGSCVLTDADVAGALGNTLAQVPSAVSITTGAITLGGATVALSGGSIRFYTSVVDSCPGADRGTCAEYADVATACAAPTCNFVVT